MSILKSENFQSGLGSVQQGHGMACVNQTLLHCVNQKETILSQSLDTEWPGHDTGKAWNLLFNLYSTMNKIWIH